MTGKEWEEGERQPKQRADDVKMMLWMIKMVKNAEMISRAVHVKLAFDHVSSYN